MINVIIVVVAVLLSTALVWFFFAPRRAAQSVEDHGVQTAHITVKGAGGRAGACGQSHPPRLRPAGKR